jgi:hypothetical protein
MAAPHAGEQKKHAMKVMLQKPFRKNITHIEKITFTRKT